MKNTSKTYFVVMQILDLLSGIFLCIAPFVLILIIPSILGVYGAGNIIVLFILACIPSILLAVLLFVASKKFKNASRYSNSELIEKRSGILGWGIFSAIMLAGTLLGFIIILIFAILTNNYILNLEREQNGEQVVSFGESVKTGAGNVVNGTKQVFGVKSEMEKQKEALIELQEWRQSGLLTEEEYNAKRKQILNID